MSRNYYVVKKDGTWKVKLESGPYLSSHRSQKAAKREALSARHSASHATTTEA